MNRTITPKDAFLNEINTYQPLESAAEAFIREHLHVTEYKKKELLLSIGEVNDRLHFIYKGLAWGTTWFRMKKDKSRKLPPCSPLSRISSSLRQVFSGSSPAGRVSNFWKIRRWFRYPTGSCKACMLFSRPPTPFGRK